MKTRNRNYTYARFDWMMTNWDYLEDQYLNRIGLREENGVVVGAVLFDHSLDVLFPLVLEEYERLYPEMADYAKGHMVKEIDPEFLMFAADDNTALQAVLKEKGLVRAVIYEGLRRAQTMGAKQAVVASDQQFYHSIGFTKLSTGTVWKPKK